MTRKCLGCGVAITALDGMRCRTCRTQTTRGKRFKDAGPVGTPGAARLAQRDAWRNAPTKGWT